MSTVPVWSWVVFGFSVGMLVGGAIIFAILWRQPGPGPGFRVPDDKDLEEHLGYPLSMTSPTFVLGAKAMAEVFLKAMKADPPRSGGSTQRDDT